jgi:CRISPR-associated endonuclease/helicase Cas3
VPSNPPLAHSPRHGVPAQTYHTHVANVHCEAVHNAQRATAFYKGDRDAFLGWIEAASVYHDLGKLDTKNQAVLQNDSRKPLPIAHDDAGVAELDKLGRQEAAVLVYAHHGGLFSRKDEMAKQRRPFRQLKRTTPKSEKVADHIDGKLEHYERVHAATNCPVLDQVEPSGLHGCGFTRRIALSCLVDADHGDTARHYGNEVEIPEIKPRWQDRFLALQRYVDQLPAGTTEREQHRNHLRKRLFEACRDAPLGLPIRTCDAPVGSGKTTAVMAHLLRVAAEREPELRHIIVVLPYTNIITQSVETYRKALVLDGERPEDVVAEHHHRADFADLELRQLAALWKAPIIVTTAVQFFETIGSNHPAQLRKLHELPGSAVFVDEMHAAIPSHLWPQMWRWLETWTRDWGGYLILASGSLPRFWELAEYKDLICANGQKSKPEAPDLVSEISFRSELKETEERRINYRRRTDETGSRALDCLGVIDFVQEKPGPRLLIVNTVQTAAVIAQTMHKSGKDVLHLSTAFAPVHRDLIVERIKGRLQRGIEDWTLVATSCVEAGMNFSFRMGFRERASTASLIQVGGRVSRSDEFEDSEVWDILLIDDRFRNNPSVSISRQALDRFTLDELNQIHPAELATFAMRREWTCGSDEKARQLIEDEHRMEYPSVSTQCRVIDTDTRTVIIDESLADAVRKGEKVSRHELMRYSVQIWADKIKKLALQPAIQGSRSEESEIYVWQYDYDPDFLGYMKGALKLENFIASGGAVI